ncbi:hypothetical protein ACHQM5_030736 [Ranunculus cassubicifolius]
MRGTPTMRTYLTHYGDLVEATYTTFITQSFSPFAGSSRFSMPNLLSGAGLTGRANPLMKYKITKYVYAMSDMSLPGSWMVAPLPGSSWAKNSNWMGYVAVSTDEGKGLMGRRDIVVAFRGTIMASEWVKDFDFRRTSAATIYKSGNALLHQGFYSIYTSSDPSTTYNKQSAREQVLAEVGRLVAQYKAEDLSVTVIGHSLGAALCTICAADIAVNRAKAAKPYPVTAFPFASPRCGDSGFKTFVDGLGAATVPTALNAGEQPLRILRIVNRPDLVTQSPPPIGFTHVGQIFEVDATFSNVLNLIPFNPAVAHDMESSYIHGIQISKGSLVEERLRMDQPQRDIALINKHQNALKPEFNVPPNWWTAQNKGMTQGTNGNWTMTAGDWILQGRHLSEEGDETGEEEHETVEKEDYTEEDQGASTST